MQNNIPEEIKRARDKFKILPGVGERSAMRNVLKLLKINKTDVIEFAHAISALTRLESCRECGIYCEADSVICKTCDDQQRIQNKTICVIESFNDYLAIENSGEYKGLYHVLGGVLNPLLNIGPKDLNIDKLKARIEKLGIEKIILAINPSLEGQATCSYLKEILGETCQIDRIGFGMPIGGSLEFLDSRTISTALFNSTRMN